MKEMRWRHHAVASYLNKGGGFEQHKGVARQLRPIRATHADRVATAFDAQFWSRSIYSLRALIIMTFPGHRRQKPSHET